MIAKLLLLKCWQRRVIIVAKDVGEAPHVEVLSRRVIVDAEDVSEGPDGKGVDKCDVGIDTKDVTEAPHAKVLVEASCCSCRRYQQRRNVVGTDVRGFEEAPLLVGIEC